MADIGSGPCWSEAQWELVNSTVTEAFAKASVAGAILPCYGPLGRSAETVRVEQFDDKSPRLRVVDDGILKLCNVTVKVELTSQQVADDTLSSALLAFRRAANMLAQEEDEIVFNGRSDARTQVRVAENPGGNRGAIVVTGDDSKGLVQVGVSLSSATSRVLPKKKKKRPETLTAVHPEDIFDRVATAVMDLESAFHPGPFACILGRALFVAVQTPNEGSMVLPADRIAGLLVGSTTLAANGQLLRSGRLEPRVGIVVSLADPTLDIVVATPPKVQFLQVNEDAKYLFRVYERFVLRLKDPGNPGVQVFTL